MSKFINKFSIPRELVRVGVLTKDAIFNKSWITTNLILSAKEIENLPYHVLFSSNVKYIRGIIFGVDQDQMALDLINTSDINYPAMNITPNLQEQQEKYDDFAIADNYPLASLLEYLNFPEELTVDDLKKLRQILTSKRELTKLAIPYSYGKIDTKLTNILDYEQQPKLAGSYYKFIVEKNSDSERCHFDKTVPDKIEQQIYPAATFELLIRNQKLGYKATGKSEYVAAEKKLVRKF